MVYGSMFSAVSGSNAQSTLIATTATNVANLNTNGYKSQTTNFANLVTSSDNSIGYSSGGVLPIVQQSVDKQGLPKSTGVGTNMTILGSGMFIVSSTADANGGYYYTRVGSFSSDSDGNLRNSNGYILFAWPLDSNSNLPGDAGNPNTTSSALISSLEPVNIKSANNAVSSTTNVSLSINLDKRQNLLSGAGASFSTINTTSVNYGINSTSLIVPNDNIAEGHNFSVATATGEMTYTYGGVAQSTSVSTGILGALNSSQIFSGASAGDSFQIGNPEIGNNHYVTYVTTEPDTTSGEFNNLASLAEALTSIQGVSARVVDNILYVGPLDGTQTLEFTDINGTFVDSLGITNIDIPYNQVTNSGLVTSNDITDGILGATSATDTFTDAVADTGITIEVTDQDGNVTGTHNFIYGTDFNNLTELQEAIDAASGLSASIINNQLVIKSDKYYELISFANIDTTNTDFVNALGLTDITKTQYKLKRFSSLSGLASLVNTEDSIAASLGSGVNSSSLKIYNRDPTAQVWYHTRYPESGAGNILEEFNVREYDSEDTTTVLGPAYDPNGIDAGNLASGKVASHYSRNITVYDSFGVEHPLLVSFLNIGQNLWSAEVYAADTNDIISTRDDGLLAYGNFRFNGDGSLRSVSGTLAQTIRFRPSNGATDLEIDINWGTAGELSGTPGATSIGKRDGLGQIASDYDSQYITPNGVSAALLSSIEITDEGYIIALYKNGLSQSLYKIPLADFRNVNGLAGLSNGIFTATSDAGDFNLREPKKGSVGQIQAGTLEQSNVDLADELTKLIIAQRGYEANSQVVRITNEILKTLNSMFS